MTHMRSNFSTNLLLVILLSAAASTSLADTPTTTPAGLGLCGQCSPENKCGGDFFCCPFQRHCIPKSSGSCLCPDKTSDKFVMHNNARVFKGASNCDGIKCEFCPGSDAPKNTCNPADGGGQTPCRRAGASADQASCVHGDHCSCFNGFVCTDTSRPGECGLGTGGWAYCIKEGETTGPDVTPTHASSPATTTNTTTTTTITIATSTTTITSTTSTTTTNPSTAATTTSASVLALCTKCGDGNQCNSGFYCCPNQLLCIPKSHANCLCPDSTSFKSNRHNNERVFKDEKNCDGQKCEFCPNTNPPKNTCNPRDGDGQTPCRRAGASIDQGYCVHGDHCSCSNGFVCSDTSRSGECGQGTGGWAHCIKEGATTSPDETTRTVPTLPNKRDASNAMSTTVYIVQKIVGGMLVIAAVGL